MGLFSSKSTSTVDQSTYVNTTTTNTTRDVGLTGQNAVDLANVLQSGNVQNTDILGGYLSSGFVDMSAQIGDTVSKALSFAGSVITSEQQQIASNYSQFGDIIQTEQEKTRTTTENLISTINENVPLIIAAITAILVIKGIMGK